MKKLSKILLVLLVMLVFIVKANAAVDFNDYYCDDDEVAVNVSERKYSRTCHVVMKVTESTIVNNVIMDIVELKHITSISLEVTPRSNWKAQKSTNSELFIENDERHRGEENAVGYVYIFGNELTTPFTQINHLYAIADFKATYVKDTSGEDCEFNVAFRINRISCYHEEGTNIYYGNNGNIVSPEDFNKDCKQPDPDPTPEPTPTYKCQKVGNVYYGKNGEKVSETKFKDDCGCRVDGNKYYDENGEETTKEIYNDQCNKPTPCSISSDGKTFYGKDGKEVEKSEYYDQCNPHCKPGDNGEYYGPNGEPIDETEYTQQCVKNICKQVGDKFYGKDGTELKDKEAFETDCGCHHDEDTNTYYDKEGKVISKEKYAEACPGNVPGDSVDTGSLSALLFIIIGIGSLSAYLLVRRYNRLY